MIIWDYIEMSEINKRVYSVLGFNYTCKMLRLYYVIIGNYRYLLS